MDFSADVYNVACLGKSIITNNIADFPLKTLFSSLVFNVKMRKATENVDWPSFSLLGDEDGGLGRDEDDESAEPTLKLQSAPAKPERSYVIVWQVAFDW